MPEMPELPKLPPETCQRLPENSQSARDFPSHSQSPPRWSQLMPYDLRCYQILVITDAMSPRMSPSCLFSDATYQYDTNMFLSSNREGVGMLRGG